MNPNNHPQQTMFDDNPDSEPIEIVMSPRQALALKQLDDSVKEYYSSKSSSH